MIDMIYQSTSTFSMLLFGFWGGGTLSESFKKRNLPVGTDVTLKALSVYLKRSLGGERVGVKNTIHERCA
jgi:hypothetical protein